MKKITIVGGGSSAHTLIPTLCESEYKINLLVSRPEKWGNSVRTEYINHDDETIWTLTGKIDVVSSDPSVVIPNSEIIILCMPVHAYRETLHRIAPHVSKKRKVYIGTIYGQGGFNWMVDEVKNKYELRNVITFSFELIPWICRTKEYGKIGITYGAKTNNVVAIDKKEDFYYLNDNFLRHLSEKWFDKGKFLLADNFLSLTLSVDNQIIHTSRLYDLSIQSKGEWQEKSDIPYFYKDFTKSSAKELKLLDNDYSKIRKAIKENYKHESFTYMLNYLELENFSYNSKNNNILESFIKSETLGKIKTPVTKTNNKYIVDKSHRFFHDDIYYGLVIAKWIAERLNIEVKNIDKILYWAQEVLGDEIIFNNKLVNLDREQFKIGTPNVYGFINLDDVIF